MTTPDDQAIVVTVEFRIKPDEDETFLDLIRGNAESPEPDPGLESFWVYRDPEDPGHILFFERWADRASFDASMRAPWRAEYMAKAEPLWDARVIGIWDPTAIRWEAGP